MPSIARAYGAEGTCRMAQVGGSQATSAVVITGSVGERAHNRREDVRVIQDALNQVPIARGGAEPPLNVDGLCYGKTLAAIRRFQKIGCGFQWPDGRIEPERRTHIELRQYYMAPSPYTVQLIYAKLLDALSWIYSARHSLREAEFALTGRLGAPRGLGLVNKYFHLEKLQTTAALAAVARMRALYNTMETCIARSTPMTQPGTGYFQEDKFENRYYAYTWAGAYTMAGPSSGGPPVTGQADLPHGGVRKDTIYVCPRKLNVQKSQFYTVVVVHELAHFCGGVDGSPTSIDDHGYRRKPGFFQLNPWQAEHTADCYAHFAGESKLGHEAPYS